MQSQNQLNKEQNLAVKHLGSPALVIAGAGSGKTRVITEKVNFLVKECNYSAKKIFAVTFTNKAALEMEERIKKKLNISEKINVYTFHTLGLKILQQEYKNLGFKKGISIFDNEDSMQIIQDIMCQDNNLESKEQLKSIMYQISLWKGERLTPDNISRHISKEDYLCANIYKEYQKRLKTYNAVDFDDLVLLPVQLLEENIDIQKKWQNKIQYLLVDEYQDTNVIQYHFIKLITKMNNFTVVGDDQQSIYAWRGAKPENLLELQKDYPNLEIIALEQNYRSTNTILKAANSLIQCNNKVFFNKNLWSDLGEGDKISVIHANDEDHESSIIVGNIFSKQLKTNCKYSNFAILYRSNYQSLRIEKALKEYKIPYQITGGVSFFSRTEIKDIMAYMKLMANLDDDASFLRIINTPKREIGSKTIEKLTSYAHKREISLFDSIFEFGLTEYLDSKAIEKLKTFANWIVKLSHEPSSETLLDMLKDISYKDWLEEQSNSLDIANKRWENVMELINWITKTMDKELPFSQALNKVILSNILEQKSSDDPNNAVQLLTLHTAKGLEFSDVSIIGFEENLLPHHNSIKSEDVDEERRLAYVGITRAKKNLTISMCLKRKKFKEHIECLPSRFLKEIDEKYLDMPDSDNLSKEEKLEKNKKHMEEILALLAT